jgi:hypothetical protein
MAEADQLALDASVAQVGFLPTSVPKLLCRPVSWRFQRLMRFVGTR